MYINIWPRCLECGWCSSILAKLPVGHGCQEQVAAVPCPQHGLHPVVWPQSVLSTLCIKQRQAGKVQNTQARVKNYTNKRTENRCVRCIPPFILIRSSSTSSFSQKDQQWCLNFRGLKGRARELHPEMWEGGAEPGLGTCSQTFVGH